MARHRFLPFASGTLNSAFGEYVPWRLVFLSGSTGPWFKVPSRGLSGYGVLQAEHEVAGTMPGRILMAAVEFSRCQCDATQPRFDAHLRIGLLRNHRRQC